LLKFYYKTKNRQFSRIYKPNFTQYVSENQYIKLNIKKVAYTYV